MMQLKYAAALLAALACGLERPGEHPISVAVILLIPSLWVFLFARKLENSVIQFSLSF